MSSRSRRSEAKPPAPKPRQSAGRSGLSRQASRDSFPGGEIVAGKRNRGQKKSYIVETSDDEEEVEEEENAEGEDEDMGAVEGEIVVPGDMDIDAEGKEDEELDAEGEDDDMDVDSAPPAAPTIKVSKPPARGSAAAKAKPTARPAAKAAASRAKDSDDDDEEELSELESEAEEIQDTVKVGGGDDEEDEEDAEGEDDEMVDETLPVAQDDEEEELDSEAEGHSREQSPDLAKMTKRQRARFEEQGEGELMKLSDEVQAKKVFTAEEQNMRRQEMARRRRNLSDKRNEEVKMETVNKLLKKQAPKVARKSQVGGADSERRGG